MIPKMIGLAGAAGLASLMLVAAAPAAEPNVSEPQKNFSEPQKNFSAPQKTEIEQIIREYLVTHPEVLQEAIAELDKRQVAADTEKSKAAVAANAATIFDSPRQVVLGNAKGDVTLVEFFDYNCGFCKGAMPQMLTLLKDDANLRVVLKEFPVLGPGSVEAAKVAVAVRMQDKSGKKYLDFHQKLLGGRGKADKARALAVAKEVGMDMARLDKDMASDEARLSLEESLKLAETLGLNGTPSYVVGEDVVVGAVGLAALRSKINTTRCGKETC
jgi:protein-disulfide isomerase